MRNFPSWKMSYLLKSVVLSVLLCSENIVSISFPPRIMEPKFTWIRNYSMGKYVKGGNFVFDTIALIQKYGYFGEKHVITTEDGYIIKIFRIPGSPQNPKSKGKPIALFQHGMLCSSDVWMIPGKNRSLALQLVDSGYDVWLGNLRGNVYGRSHKKLSPDKDIDFWRFSYHEYGVYDLSATINYITKITKEKSLMLIGHSIGVLPGIALLSTLPEYNSKVRLIVHFGPTVFWKHTEFPPFFQFFIKFGKAVQVFTKEQETAFEEYLKHASDVFFGLTATQTRLLAYDFAVEVGAKFPESWKEEKKAGFDWFRGFMQRHQRLSLRKPEATTLRKKSASLNTMHRVECFRVGRT